jgi:phospholipase C
MQDVSRRSVLKAIAAGAGLAAFRPVTGALAATAGLALRPAGSLPNPRLAPGTDSLPQIKHIVVLMMENHSYDAYFGALGRGDGLTMKNGRPVNANPDHHGAPVFSHHATESTCQAHNSVGQSWNTSHRCWNSGRMDGFVTANSPSAMAYWTGEDIPFYWSLAKNFTLCDRYFSSVMAQTYPNRRFLLAASAFGQVGDPFPSPSDPEPRPTGYSTICDLLNAYGITWKDYFADLPTVGLFPHTFERNPDKIRHVSEFFVDAAAGTLPSVSIVDPESAEGSEEAPEDISVGQAYAERVIQAVMTGAGWANTVLVFTYDEGGGYYDHVPPAPAVRPDNITPSVDPHDTFGDLYSFYGFRVPTVVVSPFSKPGAVSSTIYDHTSILKLIETKWNLPALSRRDANANNMLDCLDLRHPPLLQPPKLAPAQPPTSFVSCFAENATGNINNAI